MVKNPKIFRVFAWIILVQVCAVSLFFLFDGPDYFKANSFTPTEEVSSLMDKLELTDTGTRILKASAPKLEDNEEFNSHCTASDASAYVLGCYEPRSGSIHLYNITTTDLPGIVESTTAHELLHAIWTHLKFWEKNSITTELAEFYNKLPEDAQLRETMELYGSDEFYDELHSRLGTEIKDLPENLENHYAKYFKNQDHIVDLFNSYSDKYRGIEKRLKKLEEEINAKSEEVESETTFYHNWGEELNNKIIEFNTSVEEIDMATYIAKRNELQTEIDKFNEYYKNLSAKIDELNELINEYNEYAVKQKEISDHIDSTAVPEATNLKKGN
ncbi:MAG: hypothetical protein Q4E47_01295 [Candidatus Saccharibacteria bacterium]|nr:hypothetical protein [Candidatus Saccharibacteria bacterium]